MTSNKKYMPSGLQAIPEVAILQSRHISSSRTRPKVLDSSTIKKMSRQIQEQKFCRFREIINAKEELKCKVIKGFRPIVIIFFLFLSINGRASPVSGSFKMKRNDKCHWCRTELTPKNIMGIPIFVYVFCFCFHLVIKIYCLLSVLQL